MSLILIGVWMGFLAILVKLGVMGDMPAAIDSYLFRLNQPMARNLHRHKREQKVFLADVHNDPVVAARLSELDAEFAALRDQVSELMQEPEWSR